MSKGIAQFFSYAFHPLFMTFYGFACILFTENYFSYFFRLPTKLILLAIALSFTCIIPIINLLLLKRMRFIKSLQLNDASERTFPYILTTIFYFGMSFLIWDFGISIVYRSLPLAAGICILLTTLINRYWKISAHLVGIGGHVGSIVFISFLLKHNFLYLLTFSFLIAGILGYSRIKLNAHNPAQVYAGFFLGAVISGFSLYALFVLQILMGRNI